MSAASPPSAAFRVRTAGSSARLASEAASFSFRFWWLPCTGRRPCRRTTQECKTLSCCLAPWSHPKGFWVELRLMAAAVVFAGVAFMLTLLGFSARLGAYHCSVVRGSGGSCSAVINSTLSAARCLPSPPVAGGTGLCPSFPPYEHIDLAVHARHAGWRAALAFGQRVLIDASTYANWMLCLGPTFTISRRGRLVYAVVALVNAILMAVLSGRWGWFDHQAVCGEPGSAALPILLRCFHALLGAILLLLPWVLARSTTTRSGHPHLRLPSSSSSSSSSCGSKTRRILQPNSLLTPLALCAHLQVFLHRVLQALWGFEGLAMFGGAATLFLIPVVLVVDSGRGDLGVQKGYVAMIVACWYALPVVVWDSFFRWTRYLNCFIRERAPHLDNLTFVVSLVGFQGAITLARMLATRMANRGTGIARASDVALVSLGYYFLEELFVLSITTKMPALGDSFIAFVMFKFTMDILSATRFVPDCRRALCRKRFQLDAAARELEREYAETQSRMLAELLSIVMFATGLLLEGASQQPLLLAAFKGARAPSAAAPGGSGSNSSGFDSEGAIIASRLLTSSWCRQEGAFGSWSRLSTAALVIFILISLQVLSNAIVARVMDWKLVRFRHVAVLHQRCFPNIPQQVTTQHIVELANRRVSLREHSWQGTRPMRRRLFSSVDKDRHDASRRTGNNAASGGTGSRGAASTPAVASDGSVELGRHATPLSRPRPEVRRKDYISTVNPLLQTRQEQDGSDTTASTTAATTVATTLAPSAAAQLSAVSEREENVTAVAELKQTQPAERQLQLQQEQQKQVVRLSRKKATSIVAGLSRRGLAAWTYRSSSLHGFVSRHESYFLVIMTATLINVAATVLQLTGADLAACIPLEVCPEDFDQLPNRTTSWCHQTND